MTTPLEDRTPQTSRAQADPSTPAEQIGGYLKALRRRLPLIAALTLIVTAVAVVLTSRQDKQYTATSQVLLLEQEPITTFLNPGAQQQSFDTERDVNTKVSLITVTPVARAVKNQLRLPDSLKQVQQDVTTAIDGTSNLVSITAQYTDPAIAQKIANAFADTYLAMRKQSAQQSLNRAAQAAQQRFDALGPAEQQSPSGRQLNSQIQSLEIAAAGQTGGVQIAKHADLPTAASSPKPVRTAVIAFVLGLLLAIGLALGLELADRRLRDEEAVEEFFGLPMLASVPRPRRRYQGSSPGDDPAQYEGYSAVATNLRFFELGPDVSVIMVTSSVPGEGKTSVTIGTARALASMNLRVVAVEADMRRPTFSQYGLGGDAGLSTVLTGATPVERALVRVHAKDLSRVPEGASPDGPSFYVLPCGPIPPNPQGLLSRQSMSRLLKQLNEAADVVLVDVPPIGTVNDPVTLARLVDGIALVVRLNRTTKEAARRTMRTLENLETPVLGVVVTDAPISADGYYAYRPAGVEGSAEAEAPDAAPSARAPS